MQATTPKDNSFFSREKEELPQAGLEPVMFCVLDAVPAEPPRQLSWAAHVQYLYMYSVHVFLHFTCTCTCTAIHVHVYTDRTSTIPPPNHNHT